MSFSKKSIGRRLLIFMLASNLVIILIMGIYIHSAAKKNALEKEKQFLQQSVRVLALSLSEIEFPKDELTEENLAALTEIIQPITEKVVAGHPTLAAGFYSRELDKIVAYAPKDQFSTLIGSSLPSDHSLRSTILNGEEDIFTWGKSLRDSDSISYLKPIFYNGKFVGQVFANEPYSVFNTQVWDTATNLYTIAIIFLALINLLIFTTYCYFAARIKHCHQAVSTNNFSIATDAEFVPLFSSLNKFKRQTERHLAILEEDSNLKHAAFNDTPVSQIIANRQGHIREVNYQTVLHLKKSKHKLQILSLMDLLSPGIKKFTDKNGLLRINSEGSLTVEIEPNEKKEFQCYINPLPPIEKKLLLVSLIDKSKETAMRERIFQMQKLDYIGQMASMTAHELKNPLAVINGFAQLGIKNSDHQNCFRYFNAILQETYRMTDFIKEMIYLQIPDNIAYHSHPINNVIKKCVTMVSGKAQTNSIEVIHSLDTTNPEAIINEPLLERALLNLLHNAIDSMQSGGRLIINSNFVPHSSQVQITISDTGPGIPLENSSKIFSSFFTTKGDKGSGLGLPSAHQIIVGGHKGKLWFETTEGMGTTFYIQLPTE